MHFRRRKRCRELISDTEELPFYAQTDTFDPMGMRIVDGILLSEVIAKLPNGYRQALVMHDVEGLEHNEIAAMRGRSQGTSKSQLHKARIMLRQLITQTKPTKHFQYD
jgi:RNA polymerase sigma-70 factor, ECF subfamily